MLGCVSASATVDAAREPAAAPCFAHLSVNANREVWSKNRTQQSKTQELLLGVTTEGGEKYLCVSTAV